MDNRQQYHLVYGDGSSMEIIRNGEVDMVLTSPPYFSSETEQLLKEARSRQKEVLKVREQLTAFALTLRPVYSEIKRVLKAGGVLAIQVKDVSYGGFMFPVAGMHREMIESTGLQMLTRTFWHKFSNRSNAHFFLKKPLVGAFRADEVEEIMIFSDSSSKDNRRPLVDLPMEELHVSTRPAWTFSPARGAGRIHPYQSPDSLVRRLIALFTEPGDLVVDPFAGAGTTLSIAVKMNRRAIGYEIDANTVETAEPAIERKLKKK